MTDRLTRQAAPMDLAPWHLLAQRAVDAAHAAGAQYADARLTRRVRHEYNLDSTQLFRTAGVDYNDSYFIPQFAADEEVVGIGVRALVDGYWGFTAGTEMIADAAVRLAQDAVRQAKAFAKGPPWTVELGQYPVAIGTWATPIQVDPFTISIDEKMDQFIYWNECASRVGVPLGEYKGNALFVREERVVATTEGALFSQTLYESGARVRARGIDAPGLALAGAGWELCLDANVPDWFLSGRFQQTVQAAAAIRARPVTLGRYTLVCDGATMAALVETTLGVATQLDRALAYEANAGGTGWLADPLGMVGTEQVTSPLVTLTANRSAPRELATVRWDDEGVTPEPFTVIKDGVIVDFQTTREQAAWLAPYYQRHHRAVRSHGCAAAESAHLIPMQHMPNLSLEPSATTTRVEDMIADVKEGIFIEGGTVAMVDAQGRTGALETLKATQVSVDIGRQRKIRNGKLGEEVVGGTIVWDSQELWKQVIAVGGPTTQMALSRDRAPSHDELYSPTLTKMYTWRLKGQPMQTTSHTVRAAAATIANQTVIVAGQRV